MTKTIVCNAGPLIHLDQLGSLDVLADFPEVYVPDEVWGEVLKHRPKALPQPFLTKKSQPQALDPGVAAVCRAFSLDAGEAACLALLAEMKDAVFLTDDAAARLVGEQMGLQVHGTIGVLIRSIRRGKRTAQEVLSLLDELPARSTLFIERSLLDSVKAQIRQQYRI